MIPVLALFLFGLWLARIAARAHGRRIQNQAAADRQDLLEANAWLNQMKETP